MYIVNPEYLLYLCKLNDIKDSIARKVVEKEYLINYECKSLKVDFLLNIGTLEYKKYSLKNRINKTKRKIELLKDIEYYEINEINSMVEDEFENQNMIEKEMFDDINIEVEYSMKDQISQKKIDELNKNFSIIVRAYDPLLHKNSSRKIPIKPSANIPTCNTIPAYIPINNTNNIGEKVFNNISLIGSCSLNLPKITLNIKI